MNPLHYRPPDLLDFKPDGEVGSGVCSGRLYLNISLRLLDNCSEFQVELMEIYRAAQWILAYGVLFTHITIFSDSQAATKSLSIVANNSRIVIPGNCWNDVLARVSPQLSESYTHLFHVGHLTGGILPENLTKMNRSVL